MSESQSHKKPSLTVIAGGADLVKNKSVCVICGKAAQPAYRPFCSKRCADVDLGHWLQESYRLPMTEKEEDGLDDDDRGNA